MPGGAGFGIVQVIALHDGGDAFQELALGGLGAGAGAFQGVVVVEVVGVGDGELAEFVGLVEVVALPVAGQVAEYVVVVGGGAGVEQQVSPAVVGALRWRGAAAAPPAVRVMAASWLMCWAVSCGAAR